MNDTALLRRLKAVDPLPSADELVAGRDDGVIDAEIARITAFPTDQVHRRRVVTRIGWRAAVGALAFGVVGIGAAYAAGIPQDVVRIFANQHTPAGAPGPWGAQNVTLAATVPVDGGSSIEVWTADNQLGGTCDYYRLVTVGQSVRDLGNGCEGASVATGASGTPPPQLLHLSVDVQRLSYQTGEGSSVILVGRVFDSTVSRGAVNVPEEEPVPLTFSADRRWVVARLPVGVDPGVDGSTMRLFTAGGSVTSTVDLVDYSTRPNVFYNADGSVSR